MTHIRNCCQSFPQLQLRTAGELQTAFVAKEKDVKIYFIYGGKIMNNVTPDIRYIGVEDKEIDLFEGQYSVPHGMTYNSYVILDEKIAVMDTVEASFTNEWLSNLNAALGGRKPDYLVVHHMEPDHSANIAAFVEAYPDATIVTNAKAFTMIDNFYGKGLGLNRQTVAAGDTLSLGRHTLSFVFAPMVHWPEVMVSYDSADKVLFSADAFGKFGAFDAPGEWAEEARRYYFGIVGKYGAQVQPLLKAASTLDIAIICPLHGPVLTQDIGSYVEKYNIWSSYASEEEGVTIAYTSVYGNTKKAALLLAEKLREKGCPAVAVADLARDDMYSVLANAFRYSRLVLATTTYNGTVFPFMKQFIDHLTERNFQKRTVAFIENGSWGPVAARIMKGMLEKSKDISYADTTVTIKSAVTKLNEADADKLAAELCVAD